ncbi:hypothetical protein [Serinicoccus chungangensis]|uniref:hypothetical protein n=1 Tax=Serinicoccus chungangensis TaxID=767452 RepID=UPI00111AA7D0|nr:hypothetical protein [Serinicoccus chungangensis]
MTHTDRTDVNVAQMLGSGCRRGGDVKIPALARQIAQSKGTAVSHPYCENGPEAWTLRSTLSA